MDIAANVFKLLKVPVCIGYPIYWNGGGGATWIFVHNTYLVNIFTTIFLQIIKQTDENWCWVENQDGRTGFCPINHLDLEQQSAELNLDLVHLHQLGVNQNPEERSVLNQSLPDLNASDISLDLFFGGKYSIKTWKLTSSQAKVNFLLDEPPVAISIYIKLN